MRKINMSSNCGWVSIILLHCWIKIQLITFPSVIATRHPSENSEQIRYQHVPFQSSEIFPSTTEDNEQAETNTTDNEVIYCAKPNGVFQDPNSRSSFIVCSESVPERKICEPKGTKFFNDSRACMWDSVETPVELKLFQFFIWLVKVTGTSRSHSMDENDGIEDSTYFIKVGIVAVLIPILYLMTIFVLRKHYCNCGCLTRTREDLITDLNCRYTRRPNARARRSGGIRVSHENNLRSTHSAGFATTAF